MNYESTDCGPFMGMQSISSLCCSSCVGFVSVTGVRRTTIFPEQLFSSYVRIFGRRLCDSVEWEEELSGVYITTV